MWVSPNAFTKIETKNLILCLRYVEADNQYIHEKQKGISIMSLGIFLAKFTEWDRIQMLSALFDILCRNQVQIYNFFLILSLF